jgi:hypothetical protein
MQALRSMQWASVNNVLAVVVFALGTAACAGPSSTQNSDGGGGQGGEPWGSGGSAGTGGGGTGGGGTGGGGTGGAGGISGGGTGFTSPKDMFDWVNSTRQQYSNHIPYDGYPFQGQNADLMTWSLILAWDDGLAAEAQAEADKVAGGAMPEGEYYPFQNEAGEGFWVTGLETNRYKVTAMSDAATPPGTDVWGNEKPPNKWHDTANGFYRMAVAYQTGTGEFNQKSKLGVGAAEGGNQQTWWVLLFSE